MSIQLIVGLGNPGAAYASTRHNVGQWMVESLAEHYSLTFKNDKKLHSQLATFNTHTGSCLVAIPDTFMNRSGQAVRAISQYYRIPVENILVAHDELDLPVGRIKLKTGGGAGGHNGLKDIISQLNSEGFHRFRLGIGHPGHKDLVEKYVLSSPNKNDKIDLVLAIDRAVSVIPLLLEGKLNLAMNQVNS